jgi:hypothetical protein
MNLTHLIKRVRLSVFFFFFCKNVGVGGLVGCRSGETYAVRTACTLSKPIKL